MARLAVYIAVFFGRFNSWFIGYYINLITFLIRLPTTGN